jgi:endoglucanase
MPPAASLTRAPIPRGPAGGPTANPFAGARFYVKPDSNARRQADAWRSSRPADAAQLEAMAAVASASWMGDWSGDIREAVREQVDTARAAGALPVLVAYDIPQRDCGQHSKGGTASGDAYRDWIRAFADGIGGRLTVVILEPDALSLTDCLSAADRAARFALIKEAVAVLGAAGAAVYLDGGHSGWHTPEDQASRLTAAGVEDARGFSLNVSNFRTTANELAYGKDLATRLRGKHFVIDTSRNGRGALGDEWCNPKGRALGERPTAETGEPLADAFFWIKTPGESDGTCNGGPAAGDWWPEFALGLAQRAIDRSEVTR